MTKQLPFVLEQETGGFVLKKNLPNFAQQTH
jgi:hypothetical protein